MIVSEVAETAFPCERGKPQRQGVRLYRENRALPYLHCQIGILYNESVPGRESPKSSILLHIKLQNE